MNLINLTTLTKLNSTTSNGSVWGCLLRGSVVLDRTVAFDGCCDLEGVCVLLGVCGLAHTLHAAKDSDLGALHDHISLLPLG